MLSLIAWFNEHDCDCILVRFSGHYEESADTANITVDAWQQDMRNGYEFAKSVAGEHKIPLFLLGYSLGGLLGMNLVLFSGETGISKQVLLAPAVAIRDTAGILKLLFWWKSLYLPSFTPEKFRANKRLSITAYKTMFSIVSKILNSKAITTTSTLVFIDSMDELISTKKLFRFLNRFIAGHYELVALDSDMKNRSGGYHHLIIDQETMGAANWKLFTARLKDFLFA
jgi:esterase/lipase